MQELFVVRRRFEEEGVARFSYYVMADALGNPVWTPLLSRAMLFEKPIAQAYEFFLRKGNRNALIDTVQLPERRKTDAAFSFIELLVVMLVVGILASLAVPNSIQLIRYELRHQALLQVRAVRNAEAEFSICQAQSLPCPGVAAQIPAAGTVVTSGYSFLFTPGGASTTTSSSSYNCYSDRGSGAPAPSCPLDGSGYIQPPCSWASQSGPYWTGNCATTVTTTTQNVWTYTAVPLAPNSSFYADGTGAIHFSDTGSTATSSSPLIQ